MHAFKKTVAAGAVAAALVGGAFGAAVLTANAQTSTTTPSAQPGNAPHDGNVDPSKGGHMANGITETLLTGADADKATAAALAAVPGGTIQRVETDAEGDAYEAHMLKPDGTPVTVKMDAGFKVTKTETGGPGGPGGGGRPGRGQAPQNGGQPTS